MVTKSLAGTSSGPVKNPQLVQHNPVNDDIGEKHGKPVKSAAVKESTKIVLEYADVPVVNGNGYVSRGVDIGGFHYRDSRHPNGVIVDNIDLEFSAKDVFDVFEAEFGNGAVAHVRTLGLHRGINRLRAVMILTSDALVQKALMHDGRLFGADHERVQISRNRPRYRQDAALQSEDAALHSDEAELHHRSPIYLRRGRSPARPPRSSPGYVSAHGDSYTSTEMLSDRPAHGDISRRPASNHHAVSSSSNTRHDTNRPASSWKGHLCWDDPSIDVPSLCKVFLRHVFKPINEDDIFYAFKSYGFIKRIKIVRDNWNQSKGYGFIYFATPEAAVNALRAEGPIYVGKRRQIVTVKPFTGGAADRERRYRDRAEDDVSKHRRSLDRESRYLDSHLSSTCSATAEGGSNYELATPYSHPHRYQNETTERYRRNQPRDTDNTTHYRSSSPVNPSTSNRMKVTTPASVAPMESERERSPTGTLRHALEDGASIDDYHDGGWGHAETSHHETTETTRARDRSREASLALSLGRPHDERATADPPRHDSTSGTTAPSEQHRQLGDDPSANSSRTGSSQRSLTSSSQNAEITTTSYYRPAGLTSERCLMERGGETQDISFRNRPPVTGYYGRSPRTATATRATVRATSGSEGMVVGYYGQARPLPAASKAKTYSTQPLPTSDRDSTRDHGAPPPWTKYL